MWYKKTNEILRKFDTKRLIFATDYPDNRKLEPTQIYGECFKILNALVYSEEKAERVCKTNVLEFIEKIQ